MPSSGAVCAAVGAMSRPLGDLMSMASLLLVGLLPAAFGAAMFFVSQWPLGVVWLLPGFLQPWPRSRAAAGALTVAVLAFFSRWAERSMQSVAAGDVPSLCGEFFTAALAFASSFAFFTGGLALRAFYERRAGLKSSRTG